MPKFKRRKATKSNIGSHGQARAKAKPVSMGLRNRKSGRKN